MLRHPIRKLSFGHTTADCPMLLSVGCVCSLIDVKIMTTFSAFPDVDDILSLAIN